jgi:hypothetical protein
VLDAGFYAAAEYYFDGVWSNVTEDERKLMIAMARREEPWTRSELTASGDAETALELLRRHDVVAEDDQGVRFASELLRRWVASYRPAS